MIILKKFNLVKKNEFTQDYSYFVKKPDNFSILRNRREVKLCDGLTPNLVYMLGSL